MKAEPTMYGILKVLKNNPNELSAKGVAEYGNYEMTSENLRWIQSEMFDLVEYGKAVYRSVNGTYFFRLV